MVEKQSPSLPASTRVILSLFLPAIGALLFTLLVSGRPSFGDRQPGLVALQLAGVGLVSWLLGWRWYGLKDLGLRFGRPLSAGAGFAFLAWVAFLIVRLVTVGGDQFHEGVPFLYLLIFEAFCTQLWTFGLFFRSVADWRGPLTAAVSSGLLFGAIALLLFQEVFAITASSVLFFAIWGILYGIIRLRTGSFLGVALIQSLQSWSAWQLFKVDQPDPDQLRNFYLVISALYTIYIWRLWPKEEEDYRV